ncbi:aldo/keto reductase [bacterium]|nr:aldo/keto reductase [bacterium]
MQYRKLGNSDLEVSAVGMGCWAIVGDSTWGPQDEADTHQAIRAALESGVNFFDTAEAYGDGFSEQILGEFFKGMRDQVILASKALPTHHTPASLRKSCEDSLRRLQTDYLDLYQLHWPCREVTFTETWDTLLALQREGKIRELGVSNFGPQDLTELMASGTPVSNQLCYNLLFRAVEYEIQPLCVEHGIGIICYSPLMQGLLTGKFTHADQVPEGRARTRHFAATRPQSRHTEEGAEEETFAAIAKISAVCSELGEPMADVALAWLLAQPAVTTVISGMRNADQARQNACAADLSLDPQILARLSDATRPVKDKLGANADMWDTESRIR